MPYEKFEGIVTRYLTRKAFEGGAGRGYLEPVGTQGYGWEEEEYNLGGGEYGWHGYGGIDAMGGKGGGKGPCWTCGEIGHRAADCPKGKGKGKGGNEGKGIKGGGYKGWGGKGEKGEGKGSKGWGKGDKGFGKGEFGSVGKGTIFTGTCN